MAWKWMAGEPVLWIESLGLELIFLLNTAHSLTPEQEWKVGLSQRVSLGFFSLARGNSLLHKGSLKSGKFSNMFQIKDISILQVPHKT